MLRITILTITSALLWNSCSAPHQAFKRAQKDLSGDIDTIYNRAHFTGFAVAIADQHATLYQKGFGYADATTGSKYTSHTLQPIASVTKTLVGIALLKAADLGKLQLDDDIRQYLPFNVYNPAFPETPITIRHLATHTSSITDNTYYFSKNYHLLPGQPPPDIVQFGDEQIFNPPEAILPMGIYLERVLSEHGEWNTESFNNAAPGTKYEYSNTATALAAFITEQATGIPFSEFTSTHILKPLGMDDSGWSLEIRSAAKLSRLYERPGSPLPFYQMITYPDGGFISSVNDMGRFLSELIKGYNGNGTLLTPVAYKEYFRAQLPDSLTTGHPTNNPYNESFNTGIFIGFGPTGYIGHTGGDPGVVTIMFFHPADNVGRIMLFNTSIASQEGNKAFYDIWNSLEKYQGTLHKKSGKQADK